MKNCKLIYAGSVKDIRQAPGSEEELIFDYSNRYSIFDWGAMPDQLEHKGEALAFMAKLIFDDLADADQWNRWELPKDLDDELKQDLKKSELYYDLKKKGAHHHGIGLISESGQQEGYKQKTNFLKVKKVEVHRPKEIKEDNGLTYDYSFYQTNPSNCLVPLEVIFRFGTPKGSSLIKRLAKNPSYANDIGLSNIPQENAWMDRPIIEFSTKLEPEDRYISKEKAQKIAGLTESESTRLVQLSLLLALRLKALFQTADLELWDGKFEFAFTETEHGRDFMLVDSVGPDELRLMHNGVQISKEVLRQFYRESDWHLATNKAKQLADERGEADWKAICIEELKQSPSPLSSEHKKLGEDIYTGIANALAISRGVEVWFKQSPDIKAVLKKIHEELA